MLNVRELIFQVLAQDFSDMRIFSFVGTGISEWLDGVWRTCRDSYAVSVSALGQCAAYARLLSPPANGPREGGSSVTLRGR